MAQMNNEQRFRGIGFEPKTAKGHPAQVDPNVSVEWFTSDTSIAEWVGAKDDAGAPLNNGKMDLEARGGVGAITVGVRADADLGEGTQPIEAQEAVNVTAAGAAILTLTGFGAPVDMP